MFKSMKNFLLLWSTQALSQLGSSMTSFALTIWLYEKTGSALQSSLLLICSYAPYVILSIFAGALSDKWNKKVTMLVCDLIAALMTVIVLILIIKDQLEPWHMYIINIIEGIMNTFQQPASETAMSIITPKEYYQKAGGLKQLSRSLISIFNPILATSFYSLFGMRAVCIFDLVTFVIAFVTLLLFIKINEVISNTQKEKMTTLIKEGWIYLKENRLILNIILFLSGINFVASAFDTVITPLIISKTGSETTLGYVTACSGVAMLIGSFITTIMKEPKDKVKVIFVCLFLSMLFENFFISLSDNPIVWCFAQILGWLPIPIFAASYDVLFKTTIPIDMQGRVYSFRNSLQFFTIPLGYFAGGFMVDKIFEPYMLTNKIEIFNKMFGYTHGSGAAFAMFVLGVLGVVWCIPFAKILLKDRNSKDII